MIIVCSLSDHKNVCESVKASHLISVIDPGFQPLTPKVIQKHLKLSFDDIVEFNKNNKIFRGSGLFNEQILPNINHINKIVNFVSTWDQSHPIVIHCWCGVSRSMAVAASEPTLRQAGRGYRCVDAAAAAVARATWQRPPGRWGDQTPIRF